jgi:hypothetical protein
MWPFSSGNGLRGAVLQAALRAVTSWVSGFLTSGISYARLRGLMDRLASWGLFSSSLRTDCSRRASWTRTRGCSALWRLMDSVSFYVLLVRPWGSLEVTGDPCGITVLLHAESDLDEVEVRLV